MREYRGKRIDNGEWAYGDLIKNKDKYFIHPQANVFKVENSLAKIMVCHEVIPETVGRFTGLPDKNGKKIFEGDIVKLEEGFWKATFNAVLIEKEERYAVYYDNSHARYDLRTQDNNLEFKRVAWHQLVEGVVEVIGNIHDNPELLKVVKE